MNFYGLGRKYKPISFAGMNRDVSTLGLTHPCPIVVHGKPFSTLEEQKRMCFMSLSLYGT